MKTPEELAEEYAVAVHLGGWEVEASIDGFLTGYKTAQDQIASSSATLNNWVGVRDRLPEENGDIVLVSDGDYCAVASYISEDKKFYYFHPCMQRITHWQPLPSLPRGEK